MHNAITQAIRRWLSPTQGAHVRFGMWRAWYARSLHAAARILMKSSALLRHAARRQAARAAIETESVAVGTALAGWLDLSSDNPLILRAIDRSTRSVALYAGGVVLACLMAVIVIDVVGRYLLNAPLAGALDLSIVSLVLIVAASLAYAGRAGAHVTADMLTTLGSPRIERAAAIAVKTLCVIVVAIWSWRLWLTGDVAARLKEGTQLLNIPFAPIYKFLSLGVGLFAAALFVELVLLVRKGEAPVLDAEKRPAQGAPP